MLYRKHKIVFLNGPPRAGKDEAGVALLRGHPDCRLYAMKRPLDGALRGFFGVDERTWALWEQHKDECNEAFPFSDWGDKTFRETKISFSEEWAKKLFGQSVFGRMALFNLQRDQGFSRYALTAVTDSGFLHEALPLIEAVGPTNALVVRIMRDGKSFDGDSRSYWDPPHDVRLINLYNNDMELDMWHKLVVRAVGKWSGYING